MGAILGLALWGIVSRFRTNEMPGLNRPLDSVGAVKTLGITPESQTQTLDTTTETYWLLCEMLLKYKRINDFEALLKTIPSPENGTVLSRVIRGELTRLDSGASLNDGRYIAIYNACEGLMDPANKAICLTLFIDLQSYVQKSSGEISDPLPSIDDVVTSAVTATHILPKHNRTYFGLLYAAMYAVGGFLATNIIAVLLSETTKLFLKSQQKLVVGVQESPDVSSTSTHV